MDARQVAAVSVFGCLPGYLLLTTAGAGAATDAYTTTGVLLGFVGAATLFAYHYRDRIFRALTVEGLRGRP